MKVYIKYLFISLICLHLTQVFAQNTHLPLADEAIVDSLTKEYLETIKLAIKDSHLLKVEPKLFEIEKEFEKYPLGNVKLEGIHKIFKKSLSSEAYEGFMKRKKLFAKTASSPPTKTNEKKIKEMLKVELQAMRAQKAQQKRFTVIALIVLLVLAGLAAFFIWRKKVNATK